ncbi:MAG: beta strand repeat-containing protein, partial [Flavisolibacter sp.]
MRHLFACPTQAPVSDGENPGKIISEGKHGLGFSGYFLKLFFSSILFLLLGAQKGLAQFDLWADGVSSTTPAWDNSLNANQSDYFQGEVIPFVLKMGNLVNGTSYSFRIEYDYYHNGSGRNAGGMAYLTTYNLSRTPPVFTTGTTPVADNSFTGTGNVGIFYTVNADVTAATNPTVFSNNGTEVVKSVTVTFTYTGSNGGAADIYWGMYLAKTGTVTDFGTAPTNGASLWPGGSLQVTASPIQNLGTSSLGNVSINPSGGAVVEGIISGMKFSDLNNNGSLDNGEPGLQGWTIYIDNDGSGTLNTGDIVATTDASGNYSFNDLLPRPSAYIVREVNQAGWAQTLPGAGASYQYSFIITAADPTHTGIFGNFTCSPPAVSFTGTLADQCSSNTTYTLTGGSPGGGTYSGDGVTGTNFNASIAGVGSHTITYSYTDANGCTNTATNSINVTADASPGTVTGTPSTICIGGTTTYSSDGTTGGAWSSDNTGVATVNSGTGVITGVAAGTATITYTVTGCNGPNTAQKTVTVSPNPSAGTVSGTPSTICIGGTTTYSSDGTTGGAWSSDNTGVATINSGTGVITGVAAGTATITYTVTGCNGPYTAQKTVTVSPNPSAGTVSGTPSTICIGGTTTYSSDGTSGGTWSSDNTGVATVNSGTGVITGVTAGTATITYTVTGCNGPYTAQKMVTVSPNPSAGTVSGFPSTICISGTTTYSSDGTTGGAWSSDNTGVATVNSGTGVITGVSAGTATITYTVTGCNGPYTAQKTVTVSP